MGMVLLAIKSSRGETVAREINAREGEVRKLVLGENHAISFSSVQLHSRTVKIRNFPTEAHYALFDEKL